jgi:hypothetical protein
MDKQYTVTWSQTALDVYNIVAYPSDVNRLS